MKYPETILITGANGQTAIQVAEALLNKGCTLLLLVHSRRDRIDRLIAKHPGKCFVANCDLASYEETSQAIQTLKQQSGKIPLGIVHTAAVRSFDAKALIDSDPAVWQSIIQSNIAFAYNILRCTLPLMAEQTSGKVVLLGSNVTRTGLPYGSAYAASKAALSNLVRSTAWEMAPYNIQINMVSPAPVETELAEDYQGEYLIFREKYFAAYRETHPAHKLVSINDVVQVILSLSRTDITMQSGEEIFLTGGVL